MLCFSSRRCLPAASTLGRRACPPAARRRRATRPAAASPAAPLPAGSLSLLPSGSGTESEDYPEGKIIGRGIGLEAGIGQEMRQGLEEFGRRASGAGAEAAALAASLSMREGKETGGIAIELSCMAFDKRMSGHLRRQEQIQIRFLVLLLF